MLDLNVLRRFWFPLCRSQELGRAPLGRTLLGTPIVLFRDRAGQAAALSDRCPHRNAPLSAGWITQGELVCPYHGWRFAHDGTCVAIPGREGKASHTSRVAMPYAVVEQAGLVWAALEPNGPPPAPPVIAPGHAVAYGNFTLEAQLIDALENFLDPTHTHFVHAGMVRSARPRRLVTAQLRGGADRVEAEYLGEGQQSGLVSRVFGGGVDRSIGRFIAPATVELEYRAGERTRLLIRLYFTPTTQYELQVFALATGDAAPLPSWLVTPPLAAILKLVARQDYQILHLQLTNLRRFGDERFSSTELDLMRPHVARLLRRIADPAEAPITPFERTVRLWL
ncbi:MAG: Rieske 2Fe-2S domain-containing protein [Oscillochloridaceae bacterium umkhey_bin13]